MFPVQHLRVSKNHQLHYRNPFPKGSMCGTSLPTLHLPVQSPKHVWVQTYQSHWILTALDTKCSWTPKPWKMKVLNPEYMGYNPSRNEGTVGSHGVHEITFGMTRPDDPTSPRYDYFCEPGFWCKVRTVPSETRNLVCPAGGPGIWEFNEFGVGVGHVWVIYTWILPKMLHGW